MEQILSHPASVFSLASPLPCRTTPFENINHTHVGDCIYWHRQRASLVRHWTWEGLFGTVASICKLATNIDALSSPSMSSDLSGIFPSFEVRHFCHHWLTQIIEKSREWECLAFLHLFVMAVIIREYIQQLKIRLLVTFSDTEAEEKKALTTVSFAV